MSNIPTKLPVVVSFISWCTLILLFLVVEFSSWYFADHLPNNAADLFDFATVISFPGVLGIGLLCSMGLVATALFYDYYSGAVVGMISFASSSVILTMTLAKLIPEMVTISWSADSQFPYYKESSLFPMHPNTSSLFDSPAPTMFSRFYFASDLPIHVEYLPLDSFWFFWIQLLGNKCLELLAIKNIVNYWSEDPDYLTMASLLSSSLASLVAACMSFSFWISPAVPHVIYLVDLLFYASGLSVVGLVIYMKLFKGVNSRKIFTYYGCFFLPLSLTTFLQFFSLLSPPPSYIRPIEGPIITSPRYISSVMMSTMKESVVEKYRMWVSVNRCDLYYEDFWVIFSVSCLISFMLVCSQIWKSFCSKKRDSSKKGSSSIVRVSIVVVLLATSTVILVAHVLFVMKLNKLSL